MKSTILTIGLLALSLAQGCSKLSIPTETAPPETAKEFWPQWRGPLATGVAPEANPASEWSETKNVKWKIKTPGFGTSTPIIWGDRVFILTAIATGKKSESKKIAPPVEETTLLGAARRQGGGFRSEVPDEAYQFVVLCLDRNTGKTLWQKVAREQVPHEGHHKDHGFASASPVTDGEHLIVSFGSRGLYCYDLNGKLIWEKDLGDLQTRMSFGEGASPALHGDTVVMNWDHEGEDDFIIALNKRTGKELWRMPRKDATTWSTPLIVEHGGKAQVVVNATEKVISYDLATGKEIWSTTGQTVNVIPSPVTDGKVVYAMSGFRGAMVQAIQLGHTGDLTGTDAILWSHNKSTPYVPSPLLVDGLLYFVSGNNGQLSCFDTRTGEAHFEAERLEGIFGIYASPVSAKDRVYVLGREGACLILKKGPTLEILATNKLDDKTDASIAVVGKQLFIRGHQNLYCIEEK